MKTQDISWPETIQRAADSIKPYVHQTPVVQSRVIDKMTDASLFFKCENLQKVGAFKMRGATNAILSLSERERLRGVATHSSGNHAQALALAARLTGVKASIVMPENAPEVKINAVKEYGADVVFCAPTLAAREQTLQQVISSTGAIFIHPYNDDRIIAGQATAAMELHQQVRNLDIMIAPVGGGGLLSGTALSSRYFQPGCLVFGAEPAGADDAIQSLEKGIIVPSISPNTIADGLLTSLGDKTFPIIQKYVDRIFSVEDENIICAMQLIWERTKLVTEPSGAVPLAVILQYPEVFKNKRVGVIISGGNVSLNSFFNDLSARVNYR